MRASPPIIGVIVALVIAVAFYFLLYKPADEDQVALEDETTSLEDTQNRLRNEISALQTIERDQVEIEAAKVRLVEYIPEGTALPSAIRQFQRAADDSGVDIFSVTFGDPAVPDPAQGVVAADTGDPGTTLTNIPVTMVVHGGYFRTVDFFRRVEVEVPRAVLVQTVSVVEQPTARFPTLQTTWTGQMFAVLAIEDIPAGSSGPAPAPTATPTPTPTEGGDS